MESKRVKFLVVDSGPFIKSSPVHEYAEKIYTVNGAIKEIKDKATLQRLQFLPYTLNIKEPTPEAAKHVLEFSKKTGDYGNLSVVDLQILALTYQLEKENVGEDHLNKEPSCKITGKSASEDNKICGFYTPNEEKGELEEEEEDNEDDEGWVTHDNIHDAQSQLGNLALDEGNVTVACVTTDFCIQNVLIQMGLKVVSVDGMLIRQTRVYILRCFSCYRTTNNVTKLFCSNCGNKTLKRVAVTVNEDGSKNIHINFKRPINIRGTRYSLPTPKGGRHSTNPIVAEDQPLPQNRPCKKALQRLNVLDEEDYVTRSSPFALNDVYSRAAQLGIRREKGGRVYNRNPNVVGRSTGQRKKK